MKIRIKRNGVTYIWKQGNHTWKMKKYESS